MSPTRSRARRRRPRTLDAAVEPYDLPPELAAIARAAARRTRLRRRERAAICAEIASTIRAHLDEGTGTGEIPAKLGDLDELAAGLRARCLRERSLLTRLLGGLKLWVGGAALVPLALYAILFIRFHLGTPEITRNFAAELSAPYAQLPAEERAERLYAKAQNVLPPLPRAGLSPLLELMPWDPGWEDAAEYLERAQPALATAREASMMPVFGARIVDHAGATPWNRAQRDFPHPAASENPLLIRTALWHLSPMREMGFLFALHARNAAEAGEARAVADDLLAILGITRHLRELPTFISDTISLRLLASASESLRLILQHHPGLFTDAHLAELAIAFSSFGDDELRLRLDGERAVFQDLLQRIYTDNGRGDGRLTPEGLRLITSIRDLKDESERRIFDDIRGPITMVMMPGRREVARIWERLAAHVEADAETPPWQPRQGTATMELNEMARRNRGYDVIALLMPSFDHTIREIDETRLARDAAIVAIALERYRQANDRHPDSLDELVPDFLRSIPIDQYDGQFLKYILRDGKPIVYSIGPNRIDNSGDFKVDDTSGRPTTPDQPLWPLPR